MKTSIDIDALLAPLPGDNPAGEDLRYTPVYEEIKEARKSEDAFALGEWQRETKSADWGMVVTVATEALTSKSKDLQITAWLTEALVVTEGFEGLSVGLTVLEGFLGNYWETVYPLMEEGDIEFRIAPFEFLNERLSSVIRQVPLTAAGYSWLTWQESRDVGYEADTKNKFGDIDEAKKQRRDELIAEGKVAAEQFDAAAAQTPETLRSALAAQLASCQEAFATLDKRVDEKFGRDAPRISDIGQALEECLRLAARIYGEQKAPTVGQKPAPSPEVPLEGVEGDEMTPPEKAAPLFVAPAEQPPSSRPSVSTSAPIAPLQEVSLQEGALWEEAQRLLAGGGIKEALERLLTASYSMP
ncbi:type VI secretion system protein TssA, partial [bacterium]|nr:type VI secretion system protein TssA [bacterium]